MSLSAQIRRVGAVWASWGRWVGAASGLQEGRGLGKLLILTWSYSVKNLSKHGESTAKPCLLVSGSAAGISECHVWESDKRAFPGFSRSSHWAVFHFTHSIISQDSQETSANMWIGDRGSQSLKMNGIWLANLSASPNLFEYKQIGFGRTNGCMELRFVLAYLMGLVNCPQALCSNL